MAEGVGRMHAARGGRVSVETTSLSATSVPWSDEEREGLEVLDDSLLRGIPFGERRFGGVGSVRWFLAEEVPPTVGEVDPPRAGGGEEGQPPSAEGPAQVALPADLQANLAARRLGPAERQQFFRRLEAYAHSPRSAAEMNFFLDGDNAWVLDQGKTKALFEFLKTRFGYAFEPGFVKGVWDIVDRHAYQRELTDERVRSVLKGFSGDRAGPSEADAEREFQTFASDAFNRRLADFLKRWAPEDVAILADVLRRSGSSLTIDALRYYDRGTRCAGNAFRAGVKAAAFDSARLGKIGGGRYAGDGAILLLAEASCPNILQRLEAAVGEFGPRPGRLTLEAVDYLASFRGDPRLAGIAEWIGRNFQVGFDMDGLARLHAAFAPREGEGDALGALAADPGSADRVRSFLEKHGLRFDPQRLRYFLWPAAALERYEAYRFAFGLAPISEKTLPELWESFAARAGADERDPLLEPDVKKAVAAILAADRARSMPKGRPETRIGDVVNAAEIVFAFRGASAASTAFFGRLADVGVILDGMELRHLGGELLGLFKECAEGGTLLDEIEALLRNMPSLRGRMGLSDVLDFVRLPKKKRDNLLHPPMGAFIGFLRERYGFDASYQDARFIALQEAGSPWRAHARRLRDADALAFFEANRGLFAAQGEEGGKLDAEAMTIVLALFLRSNADRAVLPAARKWQAVTGKAIDQIFLLSYADGSARFLDDPALPRLLRALDALGLGGKAREGVSLLREFMPSSAVLGSADFRRFFGEVPRAFGFPSGDFLDLQQALSLFRDPRMRRFLSRADAQAFVRDLVGMGFEPAWDTLAQARALFEHKGTLQDLRKIEEVFGIRLAEAIALVRRVAASPEIAMQQGMLMGLDAKGFDFFAEYLSMAATGDIALLTGEGARAAHARLKATTGYAFTLLDLSTFVTLLKGPHIRAYLMSEAFASLWKELRRRCPKLAFFLSSADTYVALGENASGAFAVMDGLQAAYRWSPKEAGELGFVSDLAGNRAAFDALVGERCRGVVASLGERRGYRFGIADMWALLHLSEQPAPFQERLSRDDVDALARRVSGRALGNDIVGRLEMARFLDDPAKAEQAAFVASEDFREILRKLGKYDVDALWNKAHVQEIGGLFEAARAPEVFDFLEGIGYVQTVFDREPLVQHLPGLVRFSRKPGAIAFVKALEALPLKGAFYRFHPSDGPALTELLSRWRPQDIRRHATPLLRGVRGGVSANDLLYVLSRRTAFSANRKRLEAGLSAGFAGDVHRMDSNFDGYASYNTPSAFSAVDLNKMAEVRRWCAAPEVRSRIGGIIRRDVERSPASELGGAILMADAPEIFEGEPLPDFSNGAYAIPREIVDRLSLSLAFYHLHATSFDAGLKAGPSGSRFLPGGDISFAERQHIDGIVITPLDERRFCLHFYDERKNVAYLGTYEVPEGSPVP